MIECSTEALCDTKVRVLFWAVLESDTWGEDVWGMLLKILASQCLRKKIRPKMELLMLSPMTTNQSQVSVLSNPKKEGLGHLVSVCLFSAGH